MSREQVQKLLGGYATGTLTPEERQALVEAALEDQEVFDALAREQSLRDLLRDPATKAQLLAALDDAPANWRQRSARWIWGHAVGLAAVACFVTVGGYVARQAHFTPPQVVYVATEPTTVEVNGAQPPTEPARPRRTFDLESAKKAATSPPEMPPPPVLGQRTATVQVIPRNFTVGGITDLTGQPPVVPLPEAAPAPRPVPPQPEVAGQLGQSAGTAGAMGGRGGFGGGFGGGGGRGLTEQAEAAMAAGAQIQVAGSQAARLADSNQITDRKPPGRDPLAVPTTIPGVYFGNARPAPGAGKLDPALVALVQRVRNGARPSAEESRFVSGDEANVRMTLTNASADSLAQLRKAGLTITRQERNELTGHIAVEKLEAITQLAFVVWITPR